LKEQPVATLCRQEVRIVGTEQDIIDLQEVVSTLINIILDGMVEVKALEGALIERHGALA
jgi:hypothetical protein